MTFLPIGTHHGCPTAIKHRQGDLVTYPERLGECGRREPTLSGCDRPHSLEPGRQRCPRLIEDGTGSHGSLAPTEAAHKPVSTLIPGFAVRPARWADKSLRPAKLLKVSPTCLIVREPPREIPPVSQIIPAYNQSRQLSQVSFRLVHPYILQ